MNNNYYEWTNYEDAPEINNPMESSLYVKPTSASQQFGPQSMSKTEPNQLPVFLVTMNKINSLLNI